MQPSKKLGKLIHIARICAQACGADFLDENYKINIITYMVVFCITVYFIFSIYTVQKQISENWTVVLEAFCMVGSVLQGISKLVVAVGSRKVLNSLCGFLQSTYASYETKGDGYVAALNKCVSRLRLVFQCVAGLYVVVVMSLVSTPLAIWMFTGRRLFVMQFYIPLMDPNTIHGYLATLLMQSTCLFFGAFGNFGGDLFVLIFFAHSKLLADIFELKVDEVNRRGENFGSPLVSNLLRDVINWHQAYMWFIKTSDEVIYWITFTQVTTTGLSMVLTLVIIFTGDWPGAYAYICISFAMLYLYTGMGTLVEIANERFLEKAYDINFYSMAIPQQKSVRLMIMSAQSMQTISVGGVVPLSVSTGLQVTKTVYSVFMMLLNFFD